MADAREVHVWNKHAEEMWNGAAHPSNKTLSCVREWVDVISPLTILDLGCGTALYRSAFPTNGYIGVDQNAVMLSYAQRRFPEDTFVLANGISLPFKSRSFDLVWTRAVLQHNRHVDKELVVAEIIRVLKPGGHYLFMENNHRPDNFHYSFPDLTEWNNDLDDGYSFTPEGWINFLEHKGLAFVLYNPPEMFSFIK